MEIMNLEINGLIKSIFIILFSAIVCFLDAGLMNIHCNHKRFLDNEGNTVHHFNYKVINREISFGETEDGFVALLNVTISAEDKEGKKVAINEFTRHIGVRDKEAALSRNLYYLDKITLTLEKAYFMLYLDFEDKISGNSFGWSKKLENLETDAMISDIEFSQQITKGKPHQGMEDFLRGKYQFYVEPSHIYYTDINDSLFFYYEIQSLYPAVDKNSYFTENIHIYNDNYSSTIENNVKGEGSTFDRIHSIGIDTLSLGYYNINISIQDRVRNRKESVNDFFVIGERKQVVQRLFQDNEKEHQILRYFLPSTYFRNWNDMSVSAKNNLIDRFWRQNDPNPHTEENEFLQTVKERIEYANRNLAHYREGWETDLGRIYIRNGAPDEIEKNYIEGDIRITRREYQIWRYRNLNRVYLFIDIQGTGNYRLIYSRNDDMEHIVHDWERFVGEDFDMGKLEN